MRKSILVGMALIAMVLGTALQSNAQQGPVLEKVWAPEQVNAGDILKVYIKGTSPGGQMRWVIVSAARGAGKSTEPTGAVPIRVMKQFRQDLNGYVYWDTKKAAVKNSEGTIWIMLEDWKGNESETKSVAIRLVPMGAKKEKPPAEFKEVEIGPIMSDAMQPLGP